MNNIEIPILNYENQLLASRKQLNDLIYAYHNRKVNNALLNHKISHLQNEIDYMNHQLDILKAELNGQPQAAKQPDTAPARHMDLENISASPGWAYSLPF